ncbi:MAG: hypothetical protein AAGB22_12440, partial [Bacteroidota bacterium]
GITIWNANHVPMVNGTGLTGHSSSTQSALIVRQPGSAEQYYVFTTDFGLGNNGLRYSIVDMSLQGGLGAVTAVKNDSLYGLAAEKITAVFHANRKDLWVIAHDKLTNEFLAYLMTSSGLNPQPVVSATGMALNNFYAGYMKASPDGFRIAQNAMGLGKTEVYDFDNATGVVSNPVTLNAANATPYGLEFSPNSKVLYTSHLTSLGVYQYDLTAGNAAAIQSSANILAPYANISDIYYGLQLGPDGKVYIAKNQHVGNNHLAAITDPDVLGAGSGYLETAVLLPSGGAVFGLPNFNQSYFHAYQIEADFWCIGDSTAFGLNSTSGLAAVSWNFGDPLSGAADSAAGFEAKHQFTDTGSYVVQAIIQFAFNAFPDTLTDTLTVHPLPHISFAADSSTLCQSDSVGVAINSPLPTTYWWSDSSTSAFLHPPLTGEYWVTATNGCGTASDSLYVVVEAPLAI